MGTSNQLLNWAANQIGTVGGSKYWKEAYGWSGNNLPWCAVFVTDALKQTNTKAAYFPSTVAFDLNDRNKIGSALVNKYNLKPGDLLSFDWDNDGVGDHVGIVEKALGNGVYQTIEGNVSNSCGRRIRYASNIICGIRPEYSNNNTLIVDGVFGNETCTALQKTLQSHGFYKNYYLDGNFGYYTKLELQKYLRKLNYYSNNWLLDGDFGVESTKALQRYLRALGYYTTSYLIDGNWGKYTTMALQRAINNKKF